MVLLRQTIEAAIAALSEPYGFEEEIEGLARAAEDLLQHVGAGGLATRQVLALGQVLAELPGAGDPAVRAELDGRLRVVLGRLVLYINVAALRKVDTQARRDALTGLRNRLGFDEETQRLADRGITFSIVFIDVDGLKRVNDTAGHKAGDDLLRRVAVVLSDSCAGGEYAYRFGGDEYAFLSTVRPAAVVDDLMQAMSTDRTPFSWGVAAFPEDGVALDAVIALADDRMYARKRERKRRPWQNAVRRAISRVRGSRK